MCLSYVQTRGSVPIHWEESGASPFQLRITVTRPLEASLPAFTRHFEDLLETYSQVHAINLLSSKDQEAALTESYEQHLMLAGERGEAIRDRVALSNFDFHAQSRLGGIESVKDQLAQCVREVGEGFGATVVSVGKDGTGEVVIEQRGVFRTNCKGA